MGSFTRRGSPARRSPHAPRTAPAGGRARRVGLGCAGGLRPVGAGQRKGDRESQSRIAASTWACGLGSCLVPSCAPPHIDLGRALACDRQGAACPETPAPPDEPVPQRGAVRGAWGARRSWSARRSWGARRSWCARGAWGDRGAWGGLGAHHPWGHRRASWPLEASRIRPALCGHRTASHPTQARPSSLAWVEVNLVRGAPLRYFGGGGWDQRLRGRP